MDIPEIRSALKRAINTISGIQADDMRDAPVVPAAIVFPDPPFLFDLTFDGTQKPRMRIMVLVRYVDTGGAQAEMDAFLSTEGAKSIKRAVEADPTLGGLVSDCLITELDSYEIIQLTESGTRYLAATLIAELWA